jgi:PDZ domain-containing protein
MPSPYTRENDASRAAAGASSPGMLFRDQFAARQAADLALLNAQMAAQAANAAQASKQANAAATRALEAALYATQAATAAANAAQRSAAADARADREAAEGYAAYAIVAAEAAGVTGAKGNSFFIAGKTDQGVGHLVMAEMARIGAKQLYWYPLHAKEFHTPEQIAYFKALPLMPYAQFGNKTYKKAEGTTNCVVAALEALYQFLGGSKGSINGVPITDQKFDSFVENFLQKDSRWVEAMVAAGLGQPVADLKSVRSGDMIQTGGHRAFVADVRRDSRGEATHVLLVEANLPKKGENWKTRSAIRNDSWIPISAITSAVRLYDLARRSGMGVQVYNVNRSLAKSVGLESPRGVYVATVQPSSPAQKAGVRAGDVILKYNREHLDNWQFPLLVFETAPGSKVPITIWRDGKENETEVGITQMTAPE